MGTVAVLDEWLLRLTGLLLIPPHLAMRCAKVQALVSSGQGHILALNDEYVWRRLKKAMPTGEIPPVGVRCLRCGATANLRDWARSATMSRNQRSAAYQDMPASAGIESGLFLLDCDGERRGAYVLERLEDMVREYDQYVEWSNSEAKRQ